MRRQIRWTEKGEDGRKLAIRVTIHGQDVKWQFKRAGMEQWNYDRTPTPDQWDALEERILHRYQRGQVAITKELELVRRRRQA